MHIKIIICTYIDLLVCLCAASRVVHVRRAPDDLPLQAITKCSVCIAAALVLFHPSVYAWLLTATRGFNVLAACVVCMAAAYWLLDFFHLSAVGPEGDRSNAPAVCCLLLFLAAATGVWAASPESLRAAPSEWVNSSHGTAAVFVAVVAAYIGGVSATALRWSLVYSTVTVRRNLRTALRILAVALVAEVCACAFKVLFTLAQLAFPVDPGVTAVANTVWYVLSLFGVWMLVAGVTHPVTAELLAGLTAVFARRALYRELGPLWAALHDAFPELTMPRSSEWFWTRVPYVWPWRARAYYRRVIEIRDGLVRLAPYYALGAEREARAAATERGLDGKERDIHTAAAVVAAALDRRARDEPAEQRCAVPEGGGHDLDSDARWLVSLSRALTTIQGSGMVPANPAPPARTPGRVGG
ncbi:MAB_1171c family putative transporter [Streptomyces sp. NPDC058417]|uniref:MAB_1171c family putative transporter n=1 Tax=unclassified Streptomyces TaxID=2593676 RepID=UPI0036525ACE